jgi:hypothetical protein
VKVGASSATFTSVLPQGEREQRYTCMPMMSV